MLRPLFPQLRISPLHPAPFATEFFELSRDKVGVERTLCRLFQQWCDVRCPSQPRFGRAHIRLRDQECRHGGRDGREKKDKQYGNNAPDDAPIIQNMSLWEVLFSGIWFHLS